MTTIRTAVDHDLDHLIALHNQCFNRHTSLMTCFGHGFVNSAYRWFIHNPNIYILVALENNKVIGALIASNKPYSGPMFWSCKKQIVFRLIKKPWLIIHPELLTRLIRTLLKKEIITNRKAINGVYGMVSSKFRKKGIFIKLRYEMFNICKKEGYEIYVSAGIKKNNIASINAWKKVGGIENKKMATKEFCYWYRYLNE